MLWDGEKNNTNNTPNDQHAEHQTQVSAPSKVGKCIVSPAYAEQAVQSQSSSVLHLPTGTSNKLRR